MTEQFIPVPDQVKEQIENLRFPAGIRFTPDGEVMVMKEKGREITMPLHVLDVPNDSAALDELIPQCHDAMHILYTAIQQIHDMKRRHVPLTRQEYFEQGVEAKTLRNLCKWKLVSENLLMLKTNSGDKRGARAVVYPTPLGRAYMRKHFDATYGLEKADGKAEPGSGDDQHQEAEGGLGSDRGTVQ